MAAVGADNSQKSEIKPELMATAAVIVDVLQQSIVMGDMHHAINAGVMTPSDVRAELGTLIAQQRPGRLADDEITIFDSSGTGVQDVAAAACAYELARDRGLGFDECARMTALLACGLCSTICDRGNFLACRRLAKTMLRCVCNVITGS